jgi:hypothetical protein
VLRIAHGVTLMTSSLRGWEAFPTPGPSPTLGSLGPSHHRRHKSRVSLRGPLCAHGVSGIPFGEVRDTHSHQTESMPSSTILVVGTPILEVPSSMVRHCVYLRARPRQCVFKFGIVPKVSVLGGPLATLGLSSRDPTYIILDPPTLGLTWVAPPLGPPPLGYTSPT